MTNGGDFGGDRRSSEESVPSGASIHVMSGFYEGLEIPDPVMTGAGSKGVAKGQRTDALLIYHHVRENAGRNAPVQFALGQLCEQIGDVDQVFAPPYHPYARALLSAVPSVDPSVKREVIRLEGAVPSAKRPPSGCRFHTRCPQKIGDICEQVVPQAYAPAPGHHIYCHLFA